MKPTQHKFPPTNLTQNNPMKITFLALATIICSATSWSAVITQYDFNYSPTAGRLTPSTVAANTTAGNVTYSGIAGGVSSANNFYFQPSSSSARNQATAISNSDYLQFSITANSGYSMNLSSLSFLYGGENGNSTNQYTVNFFVMSSVDNYSSVVGSTTPYIVLPGSSTSNTPNTFSVDLSALSSYQNLTSATFRVYSYIDNVPTYTTNMRPRVDTLALNGTVAAIPEPATSILVGVGIIGFILRLRKRHGAGRKPANI